MIKTTYFANLKNVIGFEPVSICRHPPMFYKGPQYLQLAPSFKLLSLYKRGFLSDQMYTNIFVPHLMEMNAQKVISDLSNLAGDNIVLVCFEKPGVFCHRHLVSEWLNCEGYNVTEYGVTEYGKKLF